METTRQRVGRVFLAMFDGTIAEGWFRWAEWLLITSALYALGTAAKADVVVYLSYFSALLTFLYAMDRIDKAIEAMRPVVDGKPFWIRLVLLPLVIVIIYVVPVALSKAMNAAFFIGRQC